MTVWYVADNGEKTEMRSTYDGKDVKFTVEHFSNYVIAYDEERAAVCPQDDTCPISKFTDADPTAWYHDGVHYVLENGIMSGYGGGKFGPGDAMTREQLVTIMYRYAQYKGVDVSVGEDTNILSYDDALTVSEFAIPAMQWAVGSGAVGGRTNTTLNPKDTETRAEIATIIMRYCTEIAR